MRKLLSGMMVGAVLASGGAVADGSHSHGTAARHAHGGQEQAAGRAGDPKKVSRTVQITMTDDMKFTPAKIEAKRGETIRFVIANAGRVKHEMVIGSMAELKEHAALMRKMPEMEHAEDNMVTVDPAKTGELIWQFTRAGAVDFACLQPGHFEAGMAGKVFVGK